MQQRPPMPHRGAYSGQSPQSAHRQPAVPPVKTVAEFLAGINAVLAHYPSHEHNAGVIFRGTSLFEHTLLPGVYRARTPNGPAGPVEVSCFQATEDTILRHFIKNASSLVDHIARDDIITWLTYAQHFGAPTRLMDFSANPLISLYFACRKEVGQTGAVCILHENAYVKSLGLNATPGKRKSHVMAEIAANVQNPEATCTPYPITFIPHYIDTRMEAQSSRFLVWGSRRTPFEELAAPYGSMLLGDAGAFFGKIPIDGDAKPALLRELSFLGVNEKRLFPGLDGIGKYISAYYAT